MNIPSNLVSPLSTSESFIPQAEMINENSLQELSLRQRILSLFCCCFMNSSVEAILINDAVEIDSFYIQLAGTRISSFPSSENLAEMWSEEPLNT